MNFPINPLVINPSEQKLFLYQEEEIRSKVLPLFTFNPEHADERPTGHGTAFRIDPWSRCLTAYHNLDDLFVPQSQGFPVKVKSDKRLVSIEVEGIGYGTFQGIWQPITEGSVEVVIEEILPNQAFMRNLSELAVIRIRQNSQSDQGTPFFPLDLSKWTPKIDETVLALGFANLDVIRPHEDEQRAINQNLYGSFGKIINIAFVAAFALVTAIQYQLKHGWPPF